MNNDTTQDTVVDPFDPKSFNTPDIIGAEADDAHQPVEGTTVKLLVFDMGHVFIDFEWDMVCQGFCLRANITDDQFRPILKHVGSLGYENGAIATADFLTELNGKLNTTLTREEFTTLWNATFRENEEMASLLASLRQSGVPLYLLSNTNEVHYEHLQGSFNVERHFDEVILSFKVGCSKPDRRIYEEVLRRSGLKPEECLFIDDLERNVRGAAELGMNAIRFVGVADLKERLRQFGFAV